MNKQQLLYSLREMSKQRRRHHYIQDGNNLVALSAEGNKRNQIMNTFLNNLRGSSLPFI